MVLPASVERTVHRWLADVDRRAPGLVVGLYVVGSVALGGFREGRSDVDVVVVLDEDHHLDVLRRAQLRSGLATAAEALRRGHSPLTGTLNGVFVRQADLATPITQLRPVAIQTGRRFDVGKVASDSSPVAWATLAQRGIAVRGPAPSDLPLDPEPQRLRSWNLENLESYWRPWAEAAPTARRFRLRPRWTTAWGTLGPLRLHHTIATGNVISKEDAGEWGLDVLDARWHPLVRDALAYRRGEGAVLRASPAERARLTSELVLEVIALATG